MATRIEALAGEMLGQTPLRRVGRAPKSLLVYRTSMPFKKLATEEHFFVDGSKVQVEVLGQGQQFVGFGIHPATGQEYQWTDRSPLDVNWEALPSVTSEQVDAFLQAATKRLSDAGAIPKSELDRRNREGRLSVGLHQNTPPSRETVWDALEHVPNSNLDYDTWIKIGFALYDGIGPDGCDVWNTWSAQSSKNDPALTRSKWDSFGSPHANPISIGTLFYFAKENGWRPSNVRQALGTQSTDSDHRPGLRVDAASPDLTVAALRDLLAATGDVYDRGGPASVIQDRLRDGAVIHPLSADNLKLLAHQRARPYIVKIKEDGTAVEKRIQLPFNICKMFLEWKGAWGLPQLNGVSSTPILREDGSYYCAEGYDAASGMWCEDLPDLTGLVPESPSLGDAQAALHTIRQTFQTFCFADAESVFDTAFGMDVVDINRPPGQDEAAFLNALLTAVCRASIPLAPGVLIRAAPVSGAGAGKGLLARCISLIAFGREPHAVTGGSNREEREKRITAELLQGGPTVFLDNLNNTAFRSDQLASAITERPARVRILGKSEMATLNATALIILTGNGLTVTEDLARRFLEIQLDPGIEDPETRKFPTDVRADVRTRRNTLLAALITIWRWGRHSHDLKQGRALGSFETWCAWVRDPLLALGCPDPVNRITAAKRQDTQRQETAEVFAVWHSHHGDSPVIQCNLHGAVSSLIDTQGRGRQFIASQLNRLSGTRIAGFVLERQPADSNWGVVSYRLQRTEAPDAKRPFHKTTTVESPGLPEDPLNAAAGGSPGSKTHRGHREHAEQQPSDGSRSLSDAPYDPYAEQAGGETSRSGPPTDSAHTTNNTGEADVAWEMSL